MQESLLYYIWRYQKFSKRPLRSLEGKEIKPIHIGNPNTRGGPDFLEAQLCYDGLLWNGPSSFQKSKTVSLKDSNHFQCPTTMLQTVRACCTCTKAIVKKDDACIVIWDII